jgi:Holliday junction resolvase RusA-like endonuclease
MPKLERERDERVIRFSVPAVPIAQPRQRNRLVTANGRTFTQNYTPGKHPVQDFKSTVRLAAGEAYDGPPLQGPPSLSVTFVLPRPQRLRWGNRPMPRCPHASKPDVDNVAKALTDALNGLLWRDDSQVAELHASRESAGYLMLLKQVCSCPVFAAAEAFRADCRSC